MIRKARAEDRAAVAACAQVAFAPYIPRIGRAPAPMEADFAAQIAAGQMRVACGDSGGEGEGGDLLGYIVFYPAGDHVMLETVAVRPEAAGKGLGRALIATCEDWARDAGIGCVRLYTNAKMVENLTLYPRLGYVETGRRQEDGFDRVYFEKRLG